MKLLMKLAPSMDDRVFRFFWTTAGGLVFLGYTCVLCLGVMTFNVSMEPWALLIFKICWWSAVGLLPVFCVSLYLLVTEK